MIRVLLVDDSPVVLAVLKRMLAAPDSGVAVVGTARNGADALAQLPKLQPQVICTDLNMPVMDGLAFTREVMQRFPCPILLLSTAVRVGRQTDPRVFQVLEAGAVDVLAKPRNDLNADLPELGKSLARKIRILAGVRVLTRHGRAAAPPPAPFVPMAAVMPAPNSAASPRLIVIGASTGGPQALLHILSALPARFPLPILVVQHISDGFTAHFLDWLRERCKLTVALATEGQAPQRGSIYFAPEDRHLMLDSRGCFALEAGTAQDLHCPSVSRLFHSVARTGGSRVVGILLTGMGGDGADGLLAIHQAGGITVAEAESSCVVFGMPQKAIALGAVQRVLPLPEIAGFVRALGDRTSRERMGQDDRAGRGTA